MGPVTTASSSPRRASVTASSSAAAAARAVSMVGCPKEQSGYLPTILYSADFGMRPDFSARSTISGPMPARSPSVIPMRGRIAHLYQRWLAEQERVIVDLTRHKINHPAL